MKGISGRTGLVLMALLLSAFPAAADEADELLDYIVAGRENDLIELAKNDAINQTATTSAQSTQTKRSQAQTRSSTTSVKTFGSARSTTTTLPPSGVMYDKYGKPIKPPENPFRF